jgi:hypothetical protein
VSSNNTLVIVIVIVITQRRASWVCVGDSATRIAVDMIADTCKGRAFGLPDRLSFIDTRYRTPHHRLQSLASCALTRRVPSGDRTRSPAGLLWVRPMKEFLAQEIALYNHFAQLSAVFIPQLDTKTSKMASINHLAEGTHHSRHHHHCCGVWSWRQLIGGNGRGRVY